MKWNCPFFSWREVKMSQPSSVTSSVCSNWADSRPSTVTAVHLSGHISSRQLPALMEQNVGRKLKQYKLHITVKPPINILQFKDLCNLTLNFKNLVLLFKSFLSFSLSQLCFKFSAPKETLNGDFTALMIATVITHNLRSSWQRKCQLQFSWFSPVVSLTRSPTFVSSTSSSKTQLPT